VIDTGPGIPEAEQTQIFDSFVHGDSAYRRRSEGAGLGLALVQQIARMHGGSVAVASTPGAGTRFTLVLPAAPDATAADPAAAA
jgi:signal transduction histidine kinase